MRFLLAVVAFYFSFYAWERQSVRACSTCKHNQSYLVFVLEMWASDHQGAYPQSLEQLQPAYLKQLPTCPASGRPPAYRAAPDYFALACAGHNHPGLVPANCPAYTATRGPLGWTGPQGARPRLPWLLWVTFGLFLCLSHRRLRPLLLSLLLLLPVQARSRGVLTACQSNLKNLAAALEMWSSDHQGHYPKRLEQLAPFYIKEIPRCPAARGDTYSLNYRSWSDPDLFAVCCSGRQHPGLGPNLPAYTAENGPLVYGANNSSPAPCEQHLREIGAALRCYHAQKRSYPKRLEQLKPRFLAQLPRCPAGSFCYDGQGRVSCPIDAHLSWGLSYYQPEWSPSHGLQKRALREDLPESFRLESNGLPLALGALLSLLLIGWTLRPATQVLALQRQATQ